MKLCVLGNSHTGAIKRAWDDYDIKDPEEINFTFFAARGRGLKSLIIEANLISSSEPEVRKSFEYTSRLGSSFDPAQFDGFLIYAAGSQAYNPQHFYSKAVTRQALIDKISKSMSFHALQLIRKLSDKPIWIGHTPLRPGNNVAANSAEVKHYLDSIQKMNDLFYADFGATILPQPIETIAEGLRTKGKFSKGSKKLAVGDALDNREHGAEDRTHMNDKFGTIWLNAFLARIL